MSPAVNPPYDALLLVAFGGPEKMEDVVPFLENVLRGKNVPRERMLEVAHHYELFGGVSPINQQMRELLEALKPALAAAGVSLPVYWGNRNWHPLLVDTLADMIRDGVQRGLALMISAYSSYSGCRQYRENIQDACEVLGEKPPVLGKLRAFYNHPSFISANVARLRESFQQFPESDRESVQVVFTAHSLPLSMARTCNYEKQLAETCRLVAERMQLPAGQWDLVYQSRSGRPQDPWLEPDILDFVRQLHAKGVTRVIIDPIGFLSDHMEVLYDLDTEAHQLCEDLGMTMVRTKTVGIHPDFIQMLVELIQERLDPSLPRRAIGQYGPRHDECPVDCCPAPQRPPMRN
ncbi:MAG: ferrochelatase [Planctomycetaceae bacterium]